MKKFFVFLLMSLFASIIIFISCKKDMKCDNCGTNPPGGSINRSPNANAGPDITIVLPTDSTILDGSASSDPDGNISEWAWRKISGPDTFTIVNAAVAQTVVKRLVAGVYQFELKVKDNGGLYASDTLRILVDNPNINQPPVANAGPDKAITLPTNALILDGSGSIDPENNIVTYSWTKIFGPAAFSIVSPNSIQTAVINLEYGIYLFELKVTDVGSLSAKDTVQVTVDSIVLINNPPIANAGPDKTITLPTNTVILNGSGSSDPENNITAFVWTKISGPSSYSISTPNNRETQVTNLVQGVYLFELKVTDAGALFSKDTVQVTVNPIITECSSGRTPIYAQLIQIGSLSTTRVHMVTDTPVTKLVFAGGSLSAPTNISPSSRVDIYDTLTQTWSTAELSVPRWKIATIAVGNKIFFAGGEYGSGGWRPSKTVDIYNVSTNTWSVDSLSTPRYDIAAATVGNKIFFAGGFKGEQSLTDISTAVDIYDLSTNSWSFTHLSEARWAITAVTSNNKIYF